MAWLETCRIDAGKQVKHLSKQGMSTRQAIKKLAQESGIPDRITIGNRKVAYPVMAVVKYFQSKIIVNHAPENQET